MENNKFIGKVYIIGQYAYDIQSLEFCGEFIKVVGKYSFEDEIYTFYLPSRSSIIKLYNN